MATKSTTKGKKVIKVRDLRAKGGVKAGKTVKGILPTGLRTNHNEFMISG